MLGSFVEKINDNHEYGAVEQWLEVCHSTLARAGVKQISVTDFHSDTLKIIQKLKRHKNSSETSDISGGKWNRDYKLLS